MADSNPLAIPAGLFRLRQVTAERVLANTPSAKRRGDQEDGDLQQVSEQFAALLLNFMIREMRATVPESNLFPPSLAKEIFTGMLDEKIAGQMAQHGGIGISRLIFDQLKTME